MNKHRVYANTYSVIYVYTDVVVHTYSYKWMRMHSYKPITAEMLCVYAH